MSPYHYRTSHEAILKMKIILTSILTVLIAITAFGKTPADSVKVYFLAGHRLFDPSLDNNGAAMDGFISKVKEANGQDNIDFISVRGYASPSGASDANADGFKDFQTTGEISDNIEADSLDDQKGQDDFFARAAKGASPAEAKSFYMAVKTNMLCDAALIPNLGAEFYVGKNLSIYGEWMYAWWDNDKRHRYWRTYGGDLGLRWWFGRKAHAKPLTGHHLGVYGGILTFDFEAGGTGYLGGKPGGTLWDRWLLNTGVEYGYSLPVANRLNIDFSIGLGYLGGNYIMYYPFDNDYYNDKEYSMHFIGPTKAEISLVWLIGRGNTNSRKGGGR